VVWERCRDFAEAAVGMGHEQQELALLDGQDRRRLVMDGMGRKSRYSMVVVAAHRDVAGATRDPTRTGRKACMKEPSSEE